MKFFQVSKLNMMKTNAGIMFAGEVLPTFDEITAETKYIFSKNKLFLKRAFICKNYFLINKTFSVIIFHFVFK